MGLPREVAAAARDFPMLVPRSYAGRMRHGDAADPLLRQVLPVDAEHLPLPGFTTDPVGDRQAESGRGLLHKYHGRVLLVLTGACAVNCRYCFRRHYPYNTASAGPKEWKAALEAIAADDSVEEVILSGGDPLMLADALLAELAEAIEQISHVRRLRIHTRLPIVMPERVTDQWTQWLAAGRLTKVVVVHANHANELDRQVGSSLARLRATGATLLNQAVLLRGVNDSTAAQRELCERLVEQGVTPYYLHQLDRVAGAGHFEVPVPEGLEIIRQLRATLPGYMVPRYVQEIAGEPNKRVLA
ncbi:EF-P beta-lysylation protein EpmB [Aeoliella sp. ICT_H6.2]|uniref:L-lysine 2,3-aminomutase n=1 Tax=Aeoliella straminimaris TaxID=2954799 RepID=A0A9X2FIW9_9BACT|nr:EF-P beta-lysylation protein EpmB [Aeoliella straminimaris]